MATPDSSRRIALGRAAEQSGLSLSTLRRALRDPYDPLPCIRVGLGDPRHARILIRRDDLEQWLQRRNAAVSVGATRDVVDEIVERVLGE